MSLAIESEIRVIRLLLRSSSSNCVSSNTTLGISVNEFPTDLKFSSSHFPNTNFFSLVSRPSSFGKSVSSIPERSSSSHSSSWAWVINESRNAFEVGIGNLENRMVILFWQQLGKVDSWSAEVGRERAIMKEIDINFES